MSFEGDWTGVFIRGDNARGYAQSLARVLSRSNTAIDHAAIEDLLELLLGAQGEGVRSELKPYSECAK